MTSARDAQNDRELLLQVTGEISTLRDAINRLTDAFTKFEEKKVVDIEKRLSDVERWQQIATGGWKAWVIAGTIGASLAGIILGILALIHK